MRNEEASSDQRTDEVDTGELLQSLDGAAGCEALSKGTADDLQVAGIAQTELKFVVGLDLSQLLDDRGVIHVDTTKSCKGLGGGFVAVRLDQETRGLGQDDHADDQDNSPSKLDSDRDTVAARVVAVFGRVVDNSSQQQAERDS